MGYKDSTGHYWELGDVGGKLALADLKSAAVDLQNEPDGIEIRLSDGNTYRWSKDSTDTADDLFVVAPHQGRGRFLLAPGSTFDLQLPFTYATADAAALATLPPNSAILIGRCFWEIGTSMTGGTSSAIGISTDTAPHNTKGDLLGGSGGDVAATLAAGDPVLGTVGTDYAGGILLIGGVKIRFDRITSAFTAGAGVVHVPGQVITLG